MRVKETAACAVIVALVLCGAYGLRGFVWEHSRAGEPDATGMLAVSTGELVSVADEEVPLVSAPGEAGPAPILPDDRLMELVNEARADVGLEALAESADLSCAAVIRAAELPASFSHTRPDGRSYKTSLEENGVEYRFCGENIAGGYPAAEDAVQAWMGSDGFRNNILNPDYAQMGVGYYDDAQGMRYWCLLFVY